MTDDLVRRWLTDDPLVLVVAATSFTIAITSCLWHHLRKQHPVAVFPSLRFSFAHAAPSTTQQQSLSVSAPVEEPKERKSTRSKERRRRGKDPFRELLKGSKKSKALLKAIKATDHSLPSVDTLSNSSVVHNDTASSTSRSSSPEPASDLLNMDRPTPRSGNDSDDGSVRSMTPNGNTPSTSAGTSTADTSDHGSLDASPQTDDISTHSLSPDSITTVDAEVNISSASTIMAHASEDTSSPPISATCADVRNPELRNSQTAHTSGSYAKLVRARTRLRLSRMDPSVKTSLLSSPSPLLPDSVASPLNSIVPCPSLSLISSTAYPADGAMPSTPTNFRGSTPPPRSLSAFEDPAKTEPSTQPLDESAASAHTQLTCMRSALEAARLREEQLRAEAERASKERDELRWGWNEDASVWRRREAELQAQIQHLMQQFQAYVAVASFQAQQASSNFSTPTSPRAHTSPRLQQHPLVSFPLPPPIQTQNSASAPPHVQALLASAPMLTAHPPGFAAPPVGVHSGMGFGVSPLLWSGLGLSVRNRDPRHGGRQTPESSASGSSSRGRRRRQYTDGVKSASDESSLGDWDGLEDENMWEEEEEDIFRNNALADAILKRPESIRGLRVGKRSNGRPPVQGVGVEERMDALKDPALDSPGIVPPSVDTSAVRQ